jgi:hypothetical protein
MRRWLLALFVISAANPVHASEAVLKSVKGAVSVRPAATGKWIKAKPGLALNRNDQVKTGATGRVQLAFAKTGATMLVKQGSWLSLKTDKRGPIVSFKAGEFLIGLRKKLEGMERFRVRTPIAVGAIRGTVFWGRHDKDANTTTFACLTGHIDVWSGGDKVELVPGQKTIVRPDSAPEEPSAHGITPDFVKTFAIDGDVGGIDDQLSSEGAAPPQ